MTPNDLKHTKEANIRIWHLTCGAYDKRLSRCSERNNERVFCAGQRDKCELDPLSLNVRYPERAK